MVVKPVGRAIESAASSRIEAGPSVRSAPINSIRSGEARARSRRCSPTAFEIRGFCAMNPV